jgi:hypothetical protein
MDWCSVYLAPQGLPKYIYLSPPLIFPTTYNGIRTKNHPVWITSGTAPIRWMGPIHIPRWEQKRTEGYVIVSRPACVSQGLCSALQRRQVSLPVPQPTPFSAHSATLWEMIVNCLVEKVSDCFLMPNEKFTAISWQEQLTFNEMMSTLY